MAGQYIGVAGVARKVKNQYIGVAGVARKIKKRTIHSIQGKYIDDDTLKDTALNWVPHSSEETCLVPETMISNGLVEGLKPHMVNTYSPLIVYLDGIRYECTGMIYGASIMYGNLNLLASMDPGASICAGVGIDIPFVMMISTTGAQIMNVDGSLTNGTVSFYVYKNERLPEKYTHYYIDELPKYDFYNADLLSADYAGVTAHLGQSGRILTCHYGHNSNSPVVYYTDDNGYHLRRYIGDAHEDYTLPMLQVNLIGSEIEVGKHLEIMSVSDDGMIVVKGAEPNVLTSPNGTKYRITVDDDGTLKTEEVAE